jgi:AcrR family transcriptional regulator
MATTIDPARGRMPADERSAVIFLAAGRLFGARGFAGTRLDDIAAAAHVTKPIVYRHFASKKALYLALLDKHEQDLPGFIERGLALAGESSPTNLVRTILEHWFDYVHLNQHAWLMLFRDSSGDEEIRERRVQVSLRAREVMASMIATLPGSTVPQEQVEATAELLTSGLAGLALWWIDHPDVAKSVPLEVAVRMSAPAFAH